MIKKEVNEYLKKYAKESDYKADIFTKEGYGQTIGAYHEVAKKCGIINPTQKWHFTESYFKYMSKTDDKPTYNRLHCPELMIWIAEVSGLNDRMIDETINYIKKYEDEKNMRGKGKNGGFFAPIEPVIKDMLRMSDINSIISDSVCWEDVVCKVSKLKFRNVPSTFESYYIINHWEKGDITKEYYDTAKLYYDKMAELLNEFDVIEPDEYDQYGVIPDTDLSELMDIHIKNNRVSKRTPDKLLKLLDEEIFPLGMDYGFLGDLIIEVFFERVQWYF